MNREQLQEILALHRDWRESRDCGKRANLRGAYLMGADLMGANLTDANLMGADLMGAYLMGANLTDANLTDAYLRGANLTDANLRYANLMGANLTGANLTDANLMGANLTRTCLDPENVPNAKADEFTATRNGRVLGYRTQHSTHVGNNHYEPGRTHKAPWFSTSDTECHPGLYLFPTKQQAVDWDSKAVIVRVSARAEDIHKAGGKYRCKQFRVLRVEE